MKWLNLFDDVPYKFVKEYNDDDDVEVDIEDIEFTGLNRCETHFTFRLSINGGMPVCNNRRFIVVKEYDSSSAYAAFMSDLWEDEYDEEEHENATTIQALARGVLTRRKIHFALLSSDPDALRRIM